MIDAHDSKALIAWLSEQDVTLSVDGCTKVVRLSDCAKKVIAAGREHEWQYTLMKRAVELARDALHKRGQLAL